MELREAAEIVIAINQFDPKVQSNEIADAIWADALAPFTKEIAWAAVKEHYRINDDTTATPGMIRKRASIMTEQQKSRERAIAVAREREVLGEHASAAAVTRYRELKAELGEAFKVPDSPKPAEAVLDLYHRLKNSPQGELVQFNRPEHTDWANEEPAA